MSDKELTSEEIAASLFGETQEFFRITAEAIIAINQRQEEMAKVISALALRNERHVGAADTVLKDWEQRYALVTQQLRDIVQWINNFQSGRGWRLFGVVEKGRMTKAEEKRLLAGVQEILQRLEVLEQRELQRATQDFSANGADPVYNLTQAAKYLSMRADTLRGLCERQRISFTRVNYRQWAFRQSELDEYLSRFRTPPRTLFR